MTKTYKLTGTRNGKTITKVVEITDCHGKLLWVRSVGNKPFFGATGYVRTTGDTADDLVGIYTYRNKLLVSDITLEEIS